MNSARIGLLVAHLKADQIADLRAGQRAGDADKTVRIDRHAAVRRAIAELRPDEKGA
jgi:hypothetical protein